MIDVLSDAENTGRADTTNQMRQLGVERQVGQDPPYGNAYAGFGIVAE